MAFWHRKDKRQKKRAQRQQRRAVKKTEKAQKAAVNGNQKRASRLQNKASKLTKKAQQNIFFDRVVLETKFEKFYPSTDEINTIKDAVALARKQAGNLEADISIMRGSLNRGKIDFWNSSTKIASIMGTNPSNADIRRFMRRAEAIINVLLNQIMYIELRGDDKKYVGMAVPSILNRPLSKNFRFYLNVPWHNNNISSMADTIIHEISHLKNLNDRYTETVGTLSTNEASRDARSYAALFNKYS